MTHELQDAPSTEHRMTLRQVVAAQWLEGLADHAWEQVLAVMRHQRLREAGRTQTLEPR